MKSILNLFSFSSESKSVIDISVPNSSFVIVIVSLLSTLSPIFTPVIGLSTNGSLWVPLPETNSGTEVVFIGWGPLFNPSIINTVCPFSPARNTKGNNKANNKRSNTQHHQ